MSLSTFERGWARPLGLLSVFQPWLYLTRGGLEPFVGRPSNLGRSLLMSNEATAASRRNTERCDAFHYTCDALVPEPPGGSWPESSGGHERME